jgi:hypothetical protein
VREELPTWVDDEPAEPARATSSRPWVLALAVVPWLVIGGLVATGLPRPGASQPSDPGPGTVADDGDLGGADVPAAVDDRVAERPDSVDVGPDVEEVAEPDMAGATRPGAVGPAMEGDVSSDPRIVATAMLVARAWLTDVGPRLELPGLRPRTDLYLEHSAVEAVDVFGEHAVVTLSTVVLERDDDVYTAATPRRVGVPVALGDPPRPAGEPWMLADIDLSPSEPEITEERDPDALLALGESLDAVGDVLRAGRTADGWWVVTTGTEDDPVRVWLRPDGRLAEAWDPDTSPEPDAESQE